MSNELNKEAVEATLLPCPFCGGKPEIETWIGNDGSRCQWDVECMKISCDCGIETTGDWISNPWGGSVREPVRQDFVERIVAIWNKRVRVAA